jgi:hypothetical protein
MVLILLGLSINATYGDMLTGVGGVVTDEQGAAVDGVKFQVCGMERFNGITWIRELNLGIMPSFYTQNDGRFFIGFNEDNIRSDVYFNKIGYAPAFLYGISTSSTNLKVVLKKGVPLTGTVTKLVKGKSVPVGGASVELQMPSEDLWYQERAITDNQGNYMFRVTPPPKDKKWQVSFLGETVSVEVKDNIPVDGPDFIVTVRPIDNKIPESSTNPVHIMYPN